MTLYIILGVAVVLFVLLLFLSVGIGVRYENGGFMIVKISFFSFNISFEKILNRFSKKKDKKETDIEKEIDKTIVDIDFVISFFGASRDFIRKKFTLDEFYLDVNIGTAEAASTAVLSGMLYTFAYNLLALINQLVYVDNPKVVVSPQYNDATFKMVVSGIIKARVVHIIAVVFIFVFKYLKYKKHKEEK